MDYLDITTVRHIIELAEVCYPMGGEPQSVSLSDAIDMAFVENPNEQALYQYVDSLSSEQLAELRALMLIGREASGEAPESWGVLYSEAIASERSSSVGYVVSKYQLAEYLSDGLTRLGLNVKC